MILFKNFDLEFVEILAFIIIEEQELFIKIRFRYIHDIRRRNIGLFNEVISFLLNIFIAIFLL